MNTQTTKHTPGPWKIDENNELPLAVIQDHEEGQGICELETVSFDTDETQANARLIAAAPELLEACKNLVAFLEQIGYVSTGNTPTANARAALAKATQ